jgi:hypothetical protein
MYASIIAQKQKISNLFFFNLQMENMLYNNKKQQKEGKLCYWRFALIPWPPPGPPLRAALTGWSFAAPWPWAV